MKAYMKLTIDFYLLDKLFETLINNLEKNNMKGFYAENCFEAKEIVKYVYNKENLSLKGLHCHIGSQIFEKKSFSLAVEKMTDFYKDRTSPSGRLAYCKKCRNKQIEDYKIRKMKERGW